MGNGYHAFFPDLEMCEADGADLEDAIENARDAAQNWISVELEEFEGDLPFATHVDDIELAENQVAKQIMVKIKFYRTATDGILLSSLSFLTVSAARGRSAEQLRIRNSYKWDPRNRIVTKSMMGILFYVQTFAKAREKGAYGAGSPDGDLGGIAAFTGCQSGNLRRSREKTWNLQSPGRRISRRQLKELIDKKREKPFKLTYCGRAGNVYRHRRGSAERRWLQRGGEGTL